MPISGVCAAHSDRDIPVVDHVLQFSNVHRAVVLSMLSLVDTCNMYHTTCEHMCLCLILLLTGGQLTVSTQPHVPSTAMGAGATGPTAQQLVRVGTRRLCSSSPHPRSIMAPCVRQAMAQCAPSHATHTPAQKTAGVTGAIGQTAVQSVPLASPPHFSL